MVERTTAGESSFHLDLGVTPGPAGGFVGLIGARVVNGKAVTAFPVGMTSFGRSDELSIRFDGHAVTGCDIGVCDLFTTFAGGMGSDHNDPNGSGPNRFYVIVEGAEVSYAFKAGGWTARRTTFAYRYADGRDSDADYVQFATTGLELFRAATLPGGRYGSVAQAVPPCSTTTTNAASRGVGSATLEGGAARRTVTCPTDRPRIVGSHATGGTRWRFAGNVVGSTELNDTRLLVVDLPAPVAKRR